MITMCSLARARAHTHTLLHTVCLNTHAECMIALSSLGRMLLFCWSEKL